MPPRLAALGLATALAVAACAPGPRPRPSLRPAPQMTPDLRATDLRLHPGRPEDVGFDPSLPATLDSLLAAAEAQRVAPALALAVGRHGRLVYAATRGRLTYEADAPPVTDSTLFDLASLTKVLATTPLAMQFEEVGLLDLDAPLERWLPELRDPSKRLLTPRLLLTHRAGFEAFAPLYRTLRGRAAYLAEIDRRPLVYPPGTRTLYSDWSFVLLGFVLERIGGAPLDDLFARRIAAPLGLRDTRFHPPAAWRSRIAPTEIDAARGGLIWGEVHDPNAWALGGVAGHAGLFGSLRDLVILAQTFLQHGRFGGATLVRPETLARWTAPQFPDASRALGWDTPAGESSAGRFFGPRSFGHTGFTGTSLWIDPQKDLFIVLLTNRVHPTSANAAHTALRRAVADAVQRAVRDAPLIDWETLRQAR